MPGILIIDDDTAITTALTYHFSDRGWDTAAAGSGRQGIALAEVSCPDIILLDMKLPDMDGMELLKQCRELPQAASIIVMTGGGSIANAVEAVKLGAEHYLTKPFNLNELTALADRIIETRKLRLENRYYQHRQDHAVVGASPETVRLHHMIDLMAENADTTVLLLGESGTGKELVAREIHRRSARQERPFLDINCAAIAETLLESEMFGHERGAFTDARDRKQGLFEVADGGTVFLDEIGELPFSLQPKLLRVLETRGFKRIGGTKELRVDVRLIAATNRDLARDMAAGRFREDLYYRLNVFPVDLPPLRDRPADIPILTRYFVDHYKGVLKKAVSGFTPEALNLLQHYSWPGNVRELRNIIERAIVLSTGASLHSDLLPPEVTGRAPHLVRPDRPSRKNNNLEKSLSEMEREYILAVLDAQNGNRSTTAKVLRIARSTLQEKLKKYGVEEVS